MTFTGRQARFRRPDARPNELDETCQRYWRYPEHSREASAYLLREASQECRRDAYFGVHLFCEAGNRRAANAVATVRALWLDEDGGHFPDDGPDPTAVILSSRERRHLYWQLAQPVAVEWAVDMNRRLAEWAGGDTGKAGLASVLRAPGTANYKRHPQVDLVVGKFTGAGPWEPEVMDQAVPELPEPLHPSSPRRAGEFNDGPEVELESYLAGVEVLGELPDSLGVKLAIVCPWISEHTGGDRTGTRVGQRENGALWFHCDHTHCQGRTWRDFKRVVRRRRFASTNLPGYSGPNLKVEIRYGR